MRLEDHYAEIVRRTGSSPRNLQCRGLTNVIRQLYFPEYSFTGRATPASGKRTDNGMSRGRRVDNDVQKWIRKSLQHTSMTLKNPTARRLRPPHAFCRAFIVLMERLRLRPIGTQVVVRCEQCDLATLVDAVFVDAQQRVVLVELKCGFEGYIDRSNGKMRGDFGELSNAPKNQHQIQLAFTRCMFERTFPELGKVDALLVRMTESGAHVSSVDTMVDRVSRVVFDRRRRV